MYKNNDGQHRPSRYQNQSLCLTRHSHSWNSRAHTVPSMIKNKKKTEIAEKIKMTQIKECFNIA